MIPSYTIQQIIEASRIEEIIGEFIVLKKRGANYLALCPFHTEKTPSFHVSPAKGIYKCFGCGKAGNAINFLMEHEHYTYPEALRYIAKKYNIEIEETVQTPEEVQLADDKESLYNILSFAQKYYTDNLLNTDEGKAIGLAYFHERGFSDNTINKFQLGYISDKWDDFTKHAVLSGYKAEYLIKTGLTVAKDDKRYDLFRSRVIFPIHNLSGRVIGFGGRIMTNDKSKPKYINSPESDIYHKSDVLYGIYFAKISIIKNDNCYLVEGYTDLISLNQSGIENVVASSGTSLTTGQIKLIKRYTPNITILYDGDEAGIKASFRGIDMILQEGLNVRVVLFPDGEDPDSFARKHRPAELEEFILTSSVDFIKFKTRLLLKETGDDPVKKSALIKDILSSISLIPDIIIRTEYVKECSRLMSISEQTLINELNKFLRKNLLKDNKPADNLEILESSNLSIVVDKQLPIEEDIYEAQESEIIRLLIMFGKNKITFQMQDPEDEREVKRLIDVLFTVAGYIVDNFKDDKDADDKPTRFKNITYQQIFEEFIKLSENNIIPDENYFLNHTDENIKKVTIDLITSPHTLSKNWEDMHQIFIEPEEKKLGEVVKSAVLSLKLKRISGNIDWVKAKLKEGLPSEEEDNYMKLLNDLVGIRNTFASFLARPIIK